MLTIEAPALTVAAFLWGSISPAFIAARVVKGIDLRQYGSGTVGGSNVGQQLGRAWMIAVGCADLLKGFLPTALLRAWDFDLRVVLFVGIATLIGHNWSLYLGFKGGRGMGTTIGLLFAWDARLALILLFIIGIGWLIKQGATSSAIALLLLAPSAWAMGDPREIVWMTLGIALVVFIKRVEANCLPLPRDPREKRAVLLRRLWMDRDVPRDQAWQERGKIQ
jgi:glycerol-3-phosphate acyltransferase PlsY